jgi:hypothetical protein
MGHSAGITDNKISFRYILQFNKRLAAEPVTDRGAIRLIASTTKGLDVERCCHL